MSTKWTERINPDLMKREASYIIYKEDNTIYALNGTTGKVDYSGTNAATVIQSAISALTNGGKIFLKAATYSLSSDISLGDNIVLCGEGVSTELQCNGGRFSTSSKSKILIKDLYINGLNLAKSLLRFVSCSEVIIENVKIRSAATSAGATQILLEDVDEARVLNCFFDMGGVSSYGIKTDAGSTNLVIKNNIFKISVNSYNPIAIYGDAQRWIVDSNVVHCTAGSPHTGIASSCSYYGVISNNIVKGFTATDEGGIEVEYKSSHGNNQSHDVIVIGNLVSNCNMGIYVRNVDGTSDKNPYEVLIVGNRAHSCSVGIKVEAGNRITVQDNDVYGCTTTISNSGTDSIIRHNKGFATENSGTATITSGSSSVTVNHELAGTPTVVTVTPSADIGDVWVDTLTSTQFTIHCDSAPGSDTTVYWYAGYRP